MILKNVIQQNIYIGRAIIEPGKQLNVDWHLANGTPVSTLIRKGYLEIVEFDGPKKYMPQVDQQK